MCAPAWPSGSPSFLPPPLTRLPCPVPLLARRCTPAWRSKRWSFLPLPRSRRSPASPAPPPAAGPQVHTGMAEQAFKQQVQSVLGDGNLTPDRATALEKMREQVIGGRGVVKSGSS